MYSLHTVLENESQVEAGHNGTDYVIFRFCNNFLIYVTDILLITDAADIITYFTIV